MWVSVGNIPNLLKKTKHNYRLNRMSFTGEYYNLLDQKNRLSIPAKFRNSLHPNNNKTFVLSRGFDKCLFLYPLEEWKIVEEQLSSLSSINNKNRNFIRNIVRYAHYVKFDSQGRIAVPDILLSYANIDKEVIVIGMLKKIELWNKNTLDKYEKQKDFLSNEDFEDLADKINF